MNLQRAAEIQVVLEGIDLPATRSQLVAYAALEDGAAAEELRRIPDREYRRLDEVGEELVRTRPLVLEHVAVPKPESGQPPGGDDYLNPHPESGAVRPDAPPDNPPQEQLEQQTTTQKRQQAKQES